MEIDLRDFLRDRDHRIRAEVAEDIARAIEASGSHPEHPPTCASCITEAVYIERCAALARNYTATATGTPTSDAPAHRSEQQMSTITVRLEVEVDGPITSDGMPKTLSWQHDHDTGDNPRFYPAELAKALNAAHDKAIETATRLGYERAGTALAAAFGGRLSSNS